MDWTQLLGFVAAACILLAYATTDRLRFRVLALAANLFFVAYGTIEGIAPVQFLHGTLLFVNGWHLSQTLRARRRDTAA